MEMLLREQSDTQPIWRVETYFDNEGDLFLTSGWTFFVQEYDLQEGWILKFRYCGDRKLAVRIFDGTQCRRHYPAWLSSDDEDEA